MVYSDDMSVFWIAIVCQLFLLLMFEIERRRKASFNQSIFMLLYALAFHIAAVILHIDVPIGLLYGPLVMSAYYSSNDATATTPVIRDLHFFPFYFFSFFYVILCVLVLSGQHVVSDLVGDYYHTAYLFLMPTSILCYMVSLLRHRMSVALESYKLSDRLLDVLIFLCLGTVFPLYIFAINRLIGLDWDWNHFVSYGILCVGLIMVAHYLFVTRVLKQEFLEPIGPVIETRMDLVKHVGSTVEASQEAERICECIKKQQLFLDPNLSLDTVAEKVGVPKYICSKLLNEELGKSFYQLVSEYRVEHAVQLMENDRRKRYTIEWIAYTSGFGCKTSFYRYFKIYKGCMPSEYQKHRIS